MAESHAGQRAATAGGNIRLLFMCSTLTTGGFERHLSQLAPALRDHGFELIVVALRHQGRFADELREAGIDVRFVGMRSRADIAGMRRAVSFAGWRPDVVVSASIDAHVVAARLARRASASHVAVEHTPPELIHETRRLHRAAYRVVAPRVDRVVGVSRTQIPELVRLGYPAASIRVIPNGIPDVSATRSPSDVRAELGLTANDFVVTLVATLRRQKRAELFVEAVLAANALDRRVRGLVAGEGPDLGLVRDRAAAGNGAVIVLGERTDTTELMVASDVIALSSAAETLPLTVLEAMALARPVVATDVGGMREPVIDGETGILVEPFNPSALASAFAQLATDPARAMEMGAAGRRRYESAYTLSTMVDSYAALLREVCAERDLGPAPH